MGDYLPTSARQGKVQESRTFGLFSRIVVCFVVFDDWEPFKIEGFSPKMSKSRIQAFNENPAHLTSRKFTLDSKNVSFVHIWMIFQWFSLKRKFVTFLSWVTHREIAESINTAEVKISEFWRISKILKILRNYWQHGRQNSMKNCFNFSKIVITPFLFIVSEKTYCFWP